MSMDTSDTSDTDSSRANAPVNTPAPTSAPEAGAAGTDTSAVFSWQRFRLLAAAHLAANRRAYMGFFFVLAAVYFVALLVLLPTTSGKALRTEVQYIIYYFGLTVSAYIFAARYFRELNQPGSALVLLMQPASVFEKWLLAACWVLLLYPLLYTALFEVMTYPARLVAIAIQYAEESPQSVAEVGYTEYAQFLGMEKFAQFVPFVRHATLDSAAAQHQLGLWLVHVTAAGYALLCSLYFRRAAMIKGLVLLLVLFLLTVLLGSLFATETTGRILGFFWQSDSVYTVLRVAEAGVVYILGVVLFWLCTPLLLWAAGFFALRERDVV